MAYESALRSAHPDGTVYEEIGDASVPWRYGSYDDEYRALRSEAGLLDHGGVGLITVTGAGHTEFLQDVLARDVEYLTPEHCMISLILDEDATPLDITTVFGMEDGALLETSVGLAERTTKYLADLAPADVAVRNLDDKALIAIEGPYSWGFVGQVIDQEFTALPFETVVETDWQGSSMLFARSGYTSEYGYKFIADVETVRSLWDVLRPTVTPVGQQALETAMLEVRQPMLHRDGRNDDILACGYNWLVDINKERFRGRQALDALIAAGSERRTIGFRSDCGPAPDAAVWAADTKIGQVIHSAYSPGLEAHLSLARVDAAFAASGLDLGVTGESGDVAEARSLSSPYVVPASWSVPLF